MVVVDSVDQMVAEMNVSNGNLVSSLATDDATLAKQVAMARRGDHRFVLALGDVATWWPELSGQIDACYLDGFAPAQNPAMWDAHLLRHATRLGAPDLTAATWSIARVVRDGRGHHSPQAPLEQHLSIWPANG